MSQNAVVAMFKSHTGVEAALTEMRQAGFDLNTLSIVGKPRADWGAIRGLLFDSGPLLMAESLNAGAGEGAMVVCGLNVLGAGPYRQGISRNIVRRYETALKTRPFVMIAHGTAAETSFARRIVQRSNLEALEEQPSKKIPEADAARSWVPAATVRDMG